MFLGGIWRWLWSVNHDLTKFTRVWVEYISVLTFQHQNNLIIVLNWFDYHRHYFYLFLYLYQLWLPFLIFSFSCHLSYPDLLYRLIFLSWWRYLFSLLLFHLFELLLYLLLIVVKMLVDFQQLGMELSKSVFKNSARSEQFDWPRAQSCIDQSDTPSESKYTRWLPK